VNEAQPAALLPSIAHLLKRAGALERVGTPDLEAIARLPAFQAEPWRRAIADFLRWSGSTLTPGTGSSVFELLLTHGRVGALAVYQPFREVLLERGGSPDEAAAKLEAVRGVVSLAAHWIREIDWNLDDADGITAEDLDASRRPSSPIGPATPSGSSRTSFPRAAAGEDAPLPGPGEGAEEGSENSPERQGASVEVLRRAADLSIPLFRADPTVRSLWKRPPQLSERAVAPPAGPRPKGPTA